MNKHLLYISLITSSLLALTACSDDVVVQNVIYGEKTPIELSVGEVSLTRAITVDPNDESKRGTIPTGTALYMVMKSEKNDADAMWTVTKGVTKDPDANKISDIDFTATGCTRYWDDCHARDAQLSVYAACAPGSTKTIIIGGKAEYPYTSSPTTGAWETTANSLKIANWEVASAQTNESVKENDLCYSNNISKYTPSGGSETDNRLKFGTQTAKRFDHGNLCFYHALSWITFEIKMGDGFSDTEFKFPTGSNIKLTNFYTKNTEFDIPSGEFTGTYSSSVITSLAQRATATTGSKFTLDAMVMPTTDMSATTAGDITITIANNKYDIAKSDLLAKISADDKTNNMLDGTKLKPGVHYVFTLRIGKTKIGGITAKVVDWETVSATELQPSNARISLALEDRGTAVTSNVDFYRTGDTGNTEISDTYEGYDWKTGYTATGNKATANYNTDKWVPTNWYWPDNATFYHFRALSPTSQTITTATDDYTTLTHGESYTDVMWGAPFKEMDGSSSAANDAKISYSTTNGFDGATPHQIYHGIGPTENVIKMLMFHMMSDVTFNVKTTTGADAVSLGDGTDANCTKIELKSIKTSGTALVGNGLVSATGDAADYLFTVHPAPNAGVITWANYGAIPQSLQDVVLVITTPDKNRYEVALKDVKVANSQVSSNNIANPYTTTDGKCQINYWYPGFKYTYNLVLKKKGISDITATILDWETVEASEDDIQIK